MKNIVIIGAGDLGKEIVWLIEDINKAKPTYVILGFLDDDEEKTGKQFFGYSVLGTTAYLEELNKKIPLSAVIAIQDGTVRKKIVESHPLFCSWESIIHPSAVIASSSKVGKGSVFFPQVTVSVDNSLGNFGLYYIHATICNDCRIGEYVSVMSNATVSEHVILGDTCFLAAGSCIYPHAAIAVGTSVAPAETVGRKSDY